jgi:hypothetical protein
LDFNKLIIKTKNNINKNKEVFINIDDENTKTEIKELIELLKSFL